MSKSTDNTVTYYTRSPKIYICLCQNSVVGAVEYGQSAGVQSVGVSDVWTQGSKTWLKLMCFTLATGTGMSLYFRGSELLKVVAARNK